MKYLTKGDSCEIVVLRCSEMCISTCTVSLNILCLFLLLFFFLLLSSCFLSLCVGSSRSVSSSFFYLLAFSFLVPSCFVSWSCSACFCSLCTISSGTVLPFHFSVCLDSSPVIHLIVSLLVWLQFFHHTSCSCLEAFLPPHPCIFSLISFFSFEPCLFRLQKHQQQQ